MFPTSHDIVPIIQNSRFCPDDDLVVFQIATNTNNDFILIESYAGTGKTTLLLDIIRRLDCNACILLSFSRTAVRVARVRLSQETGQWLSSQTFDSLFLHLHGDKVANKDEATFETYRDMVVETREEDLRDFMCKTRTVNYNFQDVKFVFVDEAQDSPPQAFEFLNLCREMGKTVILTGDGRQAIYQFMNTVNIFDMIPSNRVKRHKLFTSKRCIQNICDFVNNRFGIFMVSSRDPVCNIETNKLEISIQCRYNNTVGQLYIHLLTHLHVRVVVNAVEADSEDKVYEGSINELMLKYGLTREKAEALYDVLQERTKACQGPTIVLSTIHRFKGDQSDLTILAHDVDVNSVSNDPHEENVKYVACTRGRYGLMLTKEFRYVGIQRPLEQLSKMFLQRTMLSGLVSVTNVVTCPIILIKMAGNPALFRFLDATSRMYQASTCTVRPMVKFNHSYLCRESFCATLVGNACDVAITWLLEQKAKAHHVQSMTVDYSNVTKLSINYDYRLRSMIKNRKIDYHTVKFYKRAIARAKIVMCLCRYLVVYQGFSISSQLIARGAHMCGVLQSFHRSHSVLTFKNTAIPPCCVDDFCKVMKRCENNLPPLLRNASQWRAVSLQGSFSNLPLYVRGTFDIMICDKDSKLHVYEVKCVRELKFVNFWQTAMYSVLCVVNNGVQVESTNIWNLRDNSMYTLPRQHVSEMCQELAMNSSHFNAAISQNKERHYPREYELADLVVR
jgi:hypothetical protein